MVLAPWSSEHGTRLFKAALVNFGLTANAVPSTDEVVKSIG